MKERKEELGMLDIAELCLGAVPAIELMQKKPNNRRIIEAIIALNVLHYKRLGYDVKVKVHDKYIKKFIEGETKDK